MTSFRPRPRKAARREVNLASAHYLLQACRSCGARHVILYPRKGYPGQESYEKAFDCLRCGRPLTSVAVPSLGSFEIHLGSEMPLGRLLILLSIGVRPDQLLWLKGLP